MKNQKLYDTLVSATRDLTYVLPEVKKPTNIVRKEYPYFTRILKAIQGKPTWYEVDESISPNFYDTNGDEIKVQVTRHGDTITKLENK